MSSDRERAELTGDILDAARRQLAEVGSSGLTLGSVAAEVGMDPSTILSYVPSRNALLTELIIDAFQSLGAAATEADRRIVSQHTHGSSPIDRFVAVATAVRHWALEHRHEYALIYGSPVPSYEAPSDTIAPATAATRILLSIMADAQQLGVPRAPRATGPTRLPISESLKGDLARIRHEFGSLPDDETLLLGIEAWIQTLGLISMETFGQLANVITDHDDHFCRTITLMARRIWAVEA